MLASNAVAIHRLNVKGDKRSCRAFMHNLHNGADLTLPSQWRERWILVRNLSVKSSTRDWQQQANAQLNHTLQQAIPGAFDGAAQANAIWFASLPEMIAFLLTELALGHTAHWYWQQWRHVLRYPRDEALARLLLMYQEHIPAIVQQLLRQRKLATVLTQLSDGSSKTLVNELAHHWQLPSLTDRRVAVSPSWQQALHSVFFSSFSVQPWQAAIRHLPANDGRVLFVSVIFGVIYAPSLLRSNAAHWHREFVRQMTSDNRGAIRTSSTPNSRSTKAEQNLTIQASDFDEPFVAQSDGVAAPLDNLVVGAQGELPRAVKTASHQAILMTTSTRSRSDRKEIVASRDTLPYQHNEGVESNVEQIELNASGSEHTETLDRKQWLADSFQTQFGGVFYLLNPLRSLITSALLLPFEGASAWHGLWDVYRIFAQRIGTLDAFIDKPLRDFFAAQIFPFHTDSERKIRFEQLNKQLPHAQALEWFLHIEKHYGDQSFWKALQHNAGFFATPAHVVSSASHLDVYYPLNRAQLDLRLASWDINPGWLPWLSRVVTFHYVDSFDEAGES